MGLIDVNRMFESVKEIPLNCPQCKGELVEIKLSVYDQVLSLSRKNRNQLKRLRCKECLHEIKIDTR